ncbi:MAG TPA: TetR/AcrR family transcriptional regulator [Mycobacteriales bacterium]|nr:TetR/AcrR family transcriptional regulator [Mycobacteriales bacterium]
MHPPTGADSGARAIRRASYGSNPVLGPHGSRARQEILAAARTLFDQRGYHATTVEAIGAAAGRSGASVYQYFANKNELFQVFVYDLGTDLLRQAGRLGPPAPTARGFDELRSWLDGISAILERHATTFRLWTSVEQSERNLLSPAQRFLDLFTQRLEPRLREAGVTGVDHGALALAILRTVERAHFIRHTWRPDVLPSELNDALARFLQMAFFPSAAASFRANPLPAGQWCPAGPVDHPGLPDPTRSMRRNPGARSQPTVDRLLAAASDVFGDEGLVAASVPDIVARAGVGHGTFYSYWTDLSAIFASLAARTAGSLIPLVDSSVAAGTELETAATAGPWLDDLIERWVGFCQHERGVLRVWSQERLPTPTDEQLRSSVASWCSRLLSDVIRRAGREDLLPETGTQLTMAALLNFPLIRSESPTWVSDEQLSRVLRYLIGRGLLGLYETPA